MLGSWIFALAFQVAGVAPIPHGGVSKVGAAPVELTSSVEQLSVDASMGNAVAASLLSDYFRYEKNYDAKWKYWVLIAAENGYLASQFDEYNILRVSDDPISQRRALYWLKRSAQGNYENAVIELRSCFPHGDFEHHANGCLGSKAQ
ncbi:hypothetical protein [Rhodanobacter sp. B04]|uniref:hypothetical protein n=1 Tax=Rhodanobacter sp. B04 TaxID=1945860 RepID=UPI0011158E91|nr:hypothetical protein [Rhodanobacter sp. B04]